MATDSPADEVVRVLTRAQRHGALGVRPIAEVIEHARSFVAALPAEVERVVDLGSGAGVPGLIVALDRPTVSVTLVDRRAKRTDELARAVQTLGWNPRVRVVCADTASLVDEPGWAGRFDAAVARGFGPPLDTLATAVRFVRRGGWVIVSEPPADQGTRWDHLDYSGLGVGVPERCGAVVRFHVEH